MPEDPDLSRVLCILSGGLAMAAGAMGVLMLSPEFAALAIVGIVVRLVWLDDKIANDLMMRSCLPLRYLKAQRWRQVVERLLMGRAWKEPEMTPALLATRFRAEMMVWTIVLTAGAATEMARTLPLGMGWSVMTAFAGFVLAGRMADRLALTLWLVECGQSLPREALMRRPPWAVMVRRRRDPGD